LHQALNAITETVAKGGRVLFVGTKRSAQEQIATAAKQSAQYYVNARWLGGMLTNWKTISNSIKHLRSLDEIIANQGQGITKRELLNKTRERDKLEKALGGIKDMGGTPDILFVIDTNKEQIAIKEANRLGIPVVAVIDTNSDPAGVNYPIPGNDDATRAVALYCELVSKAIIEGISKSAINSGDDIGAAAEPVAEAATA
jgi:small subunit ribosomal protein S2